MSLLVGAVMLFVAALMVVWLWAHRLPFRLWRPVECAIALGGLFALLAALDQSDSEERKKEIDKRAVATEEKRSTVMISTAYLMDECGVSWDVVLNQTNNQPRACAVMNPKRQGESCHAVCWIGHMVHQDRNLPFVRERASENAGRLKSNVCSNPEVKPYDICAGIDAYATAARALDEALEKDKNAGNFANSRWFAASQLVLALLLGAFAGKLARDAWESTRGDDRMSKRLLAVVMLPWGWIVQCARRRAPVSPEEPPP
jgi:hypothetical protein